jgi:hypothetical protein
VRALGGCGGRRQARVYLDLCSAKIAPECAEREEQAETHLTLATGDETGDLRQTQAGSATRWLRGNPSSEFFIRGRGSL